MMRKNSHDEEKFKKREKKFKSTRVESQKGR